MPGTVGPGKALDLYHPATRPTEQVTTKWRSPQRPQLHHQDLVVPSGRGATGGNGRRTLRAGSGRPQWHAQQVGALDQFRRQTTPDYLFDSGPAGGVHVLAQQRRKCRQIVRPGQVHADRSVLSDHQACVSPHRRRSPSAHARQRSPLPEQRRAVGRVATQRLVPVDKAPHAVNEGSRGGPG